MNCLEHVSKVLGKKAALEELSKVTNIYPRSSFEKTPLDICFPWGDTPQGFEFWDHIHRFKNDKLFQPAQCIPLKPRHWNQLKSCLTQTRDLSEVADRMEINTLTLSRILSGLGYPVIEGFIIKAALHPIITHYHQFGEDQTVFPVSIGFFDDYDLLAQAIQDYDHNHLPTLYRQQITLNKTIYPRGLKA